MKVGGTKRGRATEEVLRRPSTAFACGAQRRYTNGRRGATAASAACPHSGTRKGPAIRLSRSRHARRAKGSHWPALTGCARAHAWGSGKGSAVGLSVHIVVGGLWGGTRSALATRQLGPRVTKRDASLLRSTMGVHPAPYLLVKVTPMISIECTRSGFFRTSLGCPRSRSSHRSRSSTINP